jgi:hypothetical protein
LDEIVSTGAISYLCPVLPYGSILSSHSIYEFKQWIAEERLKCEEFSSQKESLLDGIDLYLRASFGTYSDTAPAVRRAACPP